MKFTASFRGMRTAAVLLLFAILGPTWAWGQTSWKGTSSTSWGTAANWTAGVPGAGTDAIIGDTNFTGAFQPSLTRNASCKSLTVGAGPVASTLTVAKAITIQGNLNIGTNGTISHSGRTITLLGDWVNAGTYTATKQAVVTFGGVTTQTVSGATTFRKMTVGASSITVLKTNISIATSLTVNGTLDPGEAPTFTVTGGTLTVNAGGKLLVKAATLSGNYTGSATLNAASIVDYASGTVSQTVNNTLTYGTLRISGAGTKTLAGNLPALNSTLATAGNILVDGGTLDLSTYTANRGATVAGGTVSVAAGTTLKIGGGNTFPANYTTHSLNPLSTVEYSGTSQSVSAESYGHLTLSSSSGAAVKTMPTGAMTVAGNLTCLLGSGSSLSATAGAPITVNGNVSIGSGTTLGGGSFSHAVDGNWINAGTFAGGSGSVTLRGTGAGVSGSGSNLFNNLVVSGAGITVASNTQVGVAGNFSTSGAGTFTHLPGGAGSFTLTGSGKSLSGAGISLNNLAVQGSVTASNSFTVAGNLAVSGSLSAAAGTVAMTGAGKTISGSGSLSLFALNVPGTISASSGFSLASDLSVAGSLSATTGTVSFIGTSSFSGSADLFDVALNGSRLVLGAGSTLGIGNTLTLTAGQFDVTNSMPNTVRYYSAGTQAVLSATYDNLLLAGGSVQNATGPLVVLGDLGISGGATFSASGFTHTVCGNWVNSGQFSAGSGTIEFRGSGDALVSGATTFNLLTVNKDSASVLVMLGDSIRAVTANIATGSVYTGTNVITITSNRTGNGTILGTITRTHAFVTGIPYAFESPFNTIDFTSVSGITSMTVRVTTDPPGDFPFGSSVNRQYEISVSPTGACTATARFHYLDSELNGNLESSMALWRYAGTWGLSGKTANNSTDNWVEQSGLSDLSGRWTFSDTANVVAWNGSAGSAWETAGNWTVINGSPSLPPSTNDTVQIGTETFSSQPQITTPIVIKGLIFGSIKAASLSLEGGSLRVVGNVSGEWTTNASHRILVNSQPLTVEGELSLGDGVSGHDISLDIASGSVAVGGALKQTVGAGIVFSGAGQLSVGGNYDYSGGAFTSGAGTVIYNGSAAQAVAGGLRYNNLSLCKSAGTAVLATPAVVGGNLLVATGGTFDVNASLSVSGKVEILTGATLNGGTATISVGGDWTCTGVFEPVSGIVLFNGVGAQSVSSSSFNTLQVNKTAGTVTLAGNLVLGGDLLISSGTLDLASYTAGRSVVGGMFSLAGGAALKIGSGSAFPSNFAVQTLAATSSVEYNGGLQTVSAQTYGNLVLSNGGSNPKTLAGATAVAGDLVIHSGATLAGASFPLTVQGNWTNQGAFSASSGSVTLGGSAKVLTGTNRFNNLSVTGSYTASGDVSVDGTMTISGTYNAGGTTTVLAGDFLNSGTFLSSGTVTFSGGAVQSLALNSGFNSSGMVNFNGSVAPSFAGASSPTFSNVTINNTAGVSPGVGWTVNGTFIVGASSTFNGGAATHTFGGGFTNNGSVTSSGTLIFNPAATVALKLRGTTFTSSGDVVLGGSSPITVTGGTLSFATLHIANSHPAGVSPTTNWAVSGDLVIGAGATLNGGTGLSHTVAGNWNNNGTFYGQSSSVTLTGVSEISGIGSSVFNHLNVAGTVTATADFDVTGNFVNNGTFDATGVAVTFSGAGASSLGGTTTPTPFDTLVINKTGATVTLAVNLVNLTALTVSGGTFDTSTFTVDQDAAGGVLVIGAGATMRMGGSSTLPLFASSSFDPASTVEYYGSGTQTIAAQNYGHLTSSSSGARILATTGPIGIAGIFTAGTNAYTVTSSTVSYNGSSPQTLAVLSYNNLELNNASGAGLTANVTVSGTLTLTAGRIATGANRLILGTGGTVVRVAGYVNGNLQKNVATGNPARTFEIGDSASYTPVVLQFTNVTVAGNVTAWTTAGEHPDIANSGLFAARDANRYWTATNGGTIFSTVGATLTFVPGDLDAGAVPANFVVGLRSGGAWTKPTVVSRSSTNIQAVGMTSLGDYAAGESLPSLYVINPAYGAVVPFRTVQLSATGNGVGMVGTMWFTNQWARGLVSGSLPATNSWSVPLSLPDYGQYTFTICGSNVSGTVMQDTVRFRRQASRIYWLNSP